MEAAAVPRDATVAGARSRRGTRARYMPSGQAQGWKRGLRRAGTLIEAEVDMN